MLTLNIMQKINRILLHVVICVSLFVTSLFLHVNNASAVLSVAPAVEPTEAVSSRWIEVNLARQRLNAWQNGKIVMTSAISSGRARTPTVRGTYRIYIKLVDTRMRGCCPFYNIAHVPYTMYFYRGYGLHGAWWHNNFGTPMSHGCVNLPVPFSKRLFEWASVGTKVVIY
jgi:lipoprotein-anchoring transpeptidase ErfK/SrfK